MCIGRPCSTAISVPSILSWTRLQADRRLTYNQCTSPSLTTSPFLRDDLPRQSYLQSLIYDLPLARGACQCPLLWFPMSHQILPSRLFKLNSESFSNSSEQHHRQWYQ